MPTANIMTSSERRMLSPDILLQVLFNILLEVLASAVKNKEK